MAPDTNLRLAASNPAKQPETLQKPPEAPRIVWLLKLVRRL